MNYSEYFGNTPAAKQSGNKVPIKKIYADSPVIVDNQNGQTATRTYQNADPIVVQRLTHEQEIMQQQQMAMSNHLAEQQKAYYDKIWNDKIDKMDEEAAPGPKKKVKKISFIDNKIKADEDAATCVDVLTPADIEINNEQVFESNSKDVVDEHLNDDFEDDNTMLIPDSETTLTENVKDEDEVTSPEELSHAEYLTPVEADNGNIVNDESVNNSPVETPETYGNSEINEVEEKNEEPVEPILAQDAEVETIEEFEEADELPEELKDLNIDEEYEAERAARLAAKEEASDSKKKSAKKSSSPKRKKPVVKAKIKK